MNYLIVDYNSVFVAKNDLATIKAKIQGIELQKPMLLLKRLMPLQKLNKNKLL